MPTSASRPPVNPAVTPEAKSILAYLYGISGKRILSGQQENNNQVKPDLQVLQEETGMLPALVGDDLGWGAGQEGWRQILVDKAKERWTAKGMLLTLSWHGCPPETIWAKESCGWSDVNKSRPQRLIDAVLNPGTPENKIWLAEMDRAAETLKKLRDAGIPRLPKRPGNFCRAPGPHSYGRSGLPLG